MFSAELTDQAASVLEAAQAKGLRIATAESCTGGLIAACLTAIAGSSDVFDRGFVVYDNNAKVEMLGVPKALLVLEGAVSEEVAVAMAEGALAHARADIAVSCTGIAGPGGATQGKPVGLVHLACAGRGATRHLRREYGGIGREAVRIATVADALTLMASQIIAVGDRK
jgi:nicotinamide-nucleotide amidase